MKGDPIPTQAGIDDYILSIINMPIINRKHLENMVILHYDIPDERAHQMVGIAIQNAIKAHEKVRSDLNLQLKHTDDMILRLKTWNLI